MGNKKKSDITTWAPEDLQIRELVVLRGAHLAGPGDRFAVLTEDNIRTLMLCRPHVCSACFNHHVCSAEDNMSANVNFKLVFARHGEPSGAWNTHHSQKMHPGRRDNLRALRHAPAVFAATHETCADVIMDHPFCTQLGKPVGNYKSLCVETCSSCIMKHALMRSSNGFSPLSWEDPLAITHRMFPDYHFLVLDRQFILSGGYEQSTVLKTRVCA